MAGYIPPPAAGGGGSAPGGHALHDEAGAALTSRPDLYVVGRGARVADDAVNNRSVLFVPDFAPDPATVNAVGPLMSGDVAGGVLNRLYLIPFYCHEPNRYVNLFRVTVATGHADAVVRVGVFGTITDLLIPRVMDCGTISAATAGTASKSIASGSRPKLPVGYGHIAVAIQGAAAQLVCGNVQPPTQELPALGGAQPNGAYFDTAAGAFPSQSFAPYSGSMTALAPYVSMEVGEAA